MIRFTLVLVVVAAVLTGTGSEDRAVASASSAADDPLRSRPFRSVAVTEGGAHRFTTAATATPAPVIGTTWAITGLVDGDSVASLPGGVEAYLEFDGERVTGKSGCNRLSGPAALKSGEIRFGSIVSTKMACGGEADATERAVMNVLNAGPVRMNTGPPLRLTAGDQGLVLEAR